MSRILGRRATGARSLGAVLVAALIATSCGGDDDGSSTSEGTGETPSASGEPRSGGTLIYGVDGEIASWLPQDLSQGSGGEDRGAFVYDTLLLLDETGQWQPHMADMESEDGVTWTMTIQEGIEFTDGTPLDAEAVKFNVELTLDPDLGSDVNISDIEEINVVDPLTVEFVLSAPNGNLPYAFASLAGMMVSPTAYEADPEGFGASPVGAGPFTMESWVRDSTATLVRNPDYWDEGKPYLDQVELQLLSDPLTRGQVLTSGEVDVAANAMEVQAAIRDLDGFGNVAESSSGAIGVVMNQSEPPFDDLRIRQAVALAFDPEVVNETLLQGAWPEPGLSCPPFARTQLECSADVWPEADLDEAKALVEDYEAENGPLDGGYELISAPVGRAASEFVQLRLKEIGIEITKLEAFEVPEYATRLQENAFQMAWLGQSPFSGPPVIVYRWLTSQERNGWHVQGGPVDPELEELLSTGVRAADPDERIEAVQAVQQKIVDDALIVWYAPHFRGLVAKDDVVFPDRYDGGGYTGPAEIWLDR